MIRHPVQDCLSHIRAIKKQFIQPVFFLKLNSLAYMEDEDKIINPESYLILQCRKLAKFLVFGFLAFSI